MDDFADINRRLESLIRLGTIAQVDHAKARVRVRSGKLNTKWLPWLTPRAGTTRDWDPPTIGEQCLLLSPSGDPTTGVALVGLFSDAHPAPSSSPDEHLRVYPDGTRIEYDHASHRLTIDCVGDLDIHLAGDARISVGGNASISVGGWGQVVASGRLLIKSLTQLVLKGPSRTEVL